MNELFPHRSPIAVAHALRNIFKDKVVCDIGCGGADFINAVSKYAKKAIGIENSDRITPVLGSEDVLLLKVDYMTYDIPKADIYYLWNPDYKDFIKKLNGVLLVPFWDFQEAFDEEVAQVADAKIDIPYDESANFDEKTSDIFKPKGVFHVWLINK